MSGIFNLQTGVPGAPIITPSPYEFRFTVDGIKFAVHHRTDKLHLTEWSTGCRVYTFHDEDPHDAIGMDFIAEAKAAELLSEHGKDKFHRYIARHTEINK